MGFPEWAPARLVEEHGRLKDKAASYREYARRDQDDPHGCCDVSWATAADEADELAERLNRLLTRPGMDAVWRALSRPPVPANARYSEHREWLLWDCIVRALDEFARRQALPGRPAQRTKMLQSVAAKAQSLADAINADAATASIARKVVACHLAVKNLEHRQGLGETPHWTECQMPFTLSGDVHDARRCVDDQADEDQDGELRWSQRPPLVRLIYWAEESERTALGDLLQTFINLVNDAAEQPASIKQPGRGETAVKAFLMRRLSEWMQWFYGQPLDDTVALIVTAVLDLAPPMTRDDVRAYRRPSGKKTAPPG